MLFPMDKLHISETWHELSMGLHHTNLDKNVTLQLLMSDHIDVLFSKEQKAWFFVGYLITRTMDDWRVLHVLSGWSLQGQLMRKPLMEELLEHGKYKNSSAILFNHGCPWLMSFTGGIEWLRPKW